MVTMDTNAYVYEQRRQGRSDSQIARSLGMSLTDFIRLMDDTCVEKAETEVHKKPEKKFEKKAKIAEKPEEKKTEFPNDVEFSDFSESVFPKELMDE